MIRLLLIGLILVCSPITTVEAQTFSGRGIFNENANRHLDNACRVRINDLRISIRDLTNDINEIRNCSARGGVAMRSAGSIICRDIVLGHHELQNGGTDVRFASDKGSSGWGNVGKMLGNKGADGQNVRCDCNAYWSMPACLPGDTGTTYLQQVCSTGNPSDCETCQGPAQTVPVSCTCSLPGKWETPSCPAGLNGTFSGSKTCVNGPCCGDAPPFEIECGTPCNDWVIQTCPNNPAIISSVSCPSGNCCGHAPTTQDCNEGGDDDDEDGDDNNGNWTPVYGSCNASPHWDTGTWEDCIDGIRRRDVTCVNQEGNRPVIDYQCSTSSGCSAPKPEGGKGEPCTLTCQGAALEKPATSESCSGGEWVVSNITPCDADPQWTTGTWDTCSKECGGGTQSRSVSCTGNTGTTTTTYACSTSSGCVGSPPEPTTEACTRNCSAANKPDTTQACNTQSCGGDACCPLPHHISFGRTCVCEGGGVNWVCHKSGDAPLYWDCH